MLCVRMMKQVNLPIYIEVENNKVFAVWYVDDYGQDCLLNEGEDYSVEYRTVPKRQARPIRPDEPINWLTPKVYQGEGKAKKGDEK